MGNKFFNTDDSPVFTGEYMAGFITQTVANLGALARAGNDADATLHKVKLEHDAETHYLADIADSDITARMLEDAASDESSSDVAIERFGKMLKAKLQRQEFVYGIPTVSDNFPDEGMTREHLQKGAMILRGRKNIPMSKLEFSSENFLTNLRYRVGKFTTNMATIKTRFDEAVRLFKERGPNEKLISNPAYCKWLGVGSRTHEPKDVISCARTRLALYDLGAAKKLLQEITASYQALSKIYEDKSAGGSKKRYDAVITHLAHITRVCTQFKERYESLPEYAAELKPADENAVKEAVSLFHAHYRLNDIRDIQLEVEQAHSVFNGQVRARILHDCVTFATLQKGYMDDRWSAEEFIATASRYSECAFMVFRANQHTLNALAYYISDSTR